MYKEIKKYEQFCDCCGVSHSAPVEVAGYATSVGWRHTRGLDLCGVCIDKISKKAILSILEDEFKQLIEDTKQEVGDRSSSPRILVSSVS